MTVSLDDVIVWVISGPVPPVFQVRTVPGGRLVRVTEAIPGLTPEGLFNFIPFWISGPMLRGVSSTTVDFPSYLKNGRKYDGILDGCDDGLELGTLDGFALGLELGDRLGRELGAALSGRTLISILQGQELYIDTGNRGMNMEQNVQQA